MSSGRKNMKRGKRKREKMLGKTKGERRKIENRK
jgi:hypothetical protein